MFLELAWRLGGLRAERSGASSYALSWFSLRLSGFFRVPAHIVRSMQNRKMWNPVLPLNTSLCHHSDKSMRQAKFQDFPKGTLKFHFFQISLFSIRFLENVEQRFAPEGHRWFSFFFGERTPQIYNRERQRNAKKVQKERCTKIMLTKCKAVCCLYDKVQLAAAKMLDL